MDLTDPEVLAIKKLVGRIATFETKKGILLNAERINYMKKAGTQGA